ncbi:MFS transporter [Solimonas sp. K1W22B-7]|uniref:MFS transporter n=1 Tax=Solimonas sp. K1W22B-7 TaxID=2303331 RepID=UPI000E3347BD|nr:MFS transporter [Solimonas sp. K1W22B-7]AXQ27516.1 MFS transporter [Solimonas sp. K1W22B-7]
MATQTREPAAGAWAPLRVPTFRALWLAILAGNVGTWVHDTAAAWLMADLSDAPLMIAAVQSATTVPVVLLALFAGALADIVDRRRYLMLAQAWMFAVASLLALLAHRGQLTPELLLMLTFALGCGAAMSMPAQNATTPELVPRAMLGSAVALGSLSMNIARSIGPALGGLVVAQFGAAWAFALNALTFLGVLLVLWRWRRDPAASALPPERLGGALRSGLRYAAHAPALRAVLVRSAAFLLFGSALAALLPVVVRSGLQASANVYGLLLGGIGAGAVAGALMLPRLRRRWSRDRLVTWATLGYAGCMLLASQVPPIHWLLPAMLLAGFCWICVLSSLQVASQMAVAGWVRARALSLYIVVFSLGIASGSLLWGTIAQLGSTALALQLAAVGACAALVLVRSWSLDGSDGLDLAPSAHWPQPLVSQEPEHDHGPVLITLEYSVADENRGRFLRLLAQLGQGRRRDGALDWDVFEDSAEPGRYLESFGTASWLEHLRQHERVSQDDRRLQEAIRELQREPGYPRIRHFIASRP